MKQLVVYDSTFGNTKTVAKEIAKTIGARIRSAPEVRPSDMKNLNLLIVGSPTHGGKPLPTITMFIAELPPRLLNGVTVAAFDTRLEYRNQNVFLRVIMQFAGYAADKLAQSLVIKNGYLAGTPIGFIVQGKNGPLREGELEKASLWAQNLIKPAPAKK